MTRLALALAALALLWGLMLAAGGTGADRTILAFLYAGGNPGLAGAARAITQLGAFEALIPITLLGMLVLALRREWRPAALLLGLTLSGRLLVELMKGWTGRLRPSDQAHLVDVQSYSFPSGHSANAVLVWLTLALLLARGPRARTAALAAAAALALLVGLSRIMLGVHWPSDVVAGWAFGLIWILLLFRLSGQPLRPS